MSSWEIRKLTKVEHPPLLAEIPQPPKELWSVGTLPLVDLPLLAIVGSRRYTTYGKQVVEHLVAGLQHYHVGVVSGLALGIDALAHEAALRANLYTLAVPGSGLHESVLYPARHKNLAHKIVAAGGGLLSELPPAAQAAQWTFPARNRIMAGMCGATLLIEADEKSGTLITARMAADYNRELLVVPGSIFSSTSRGTHQFLKLGATPVTTADDIIEALHLKRTVPDTSTNTLPSLSPQAIQVLTLLREPRDRDYLIRALQLPHGEASVLLMQLELDGYIVVEAGQYTALLQLPHNPIPLT